MVCCHVPLNVCAEVVESSVGSENPAAFTNPLPPHAARTSPLPSNLRIFQSEQLNPAARPTPRRLAGNRWQVSFDFLPAKPISVEPVQENISTDAGLLIFRQWDQKLGFTEGFAQQLDDRRCDPDHSILEMVRSRVFGILAGYEDQNDHDALRSDAIFKLLANRFPDDDDLASQPTPSVP